MPLSSPRLFPALVLLIGLGAAAAQPAFRQQLEPDGSPDRRSDGAGVPESIDWVTPPLGKGPFLMESAEERRLRVVVVARGLEQPWSLAFLPSGDMLITERPGRLRIVRKGLLDPTPIAGVPAVWAEGIQGLMDVALHPRFSENGWVYITYNKPVGAAGAITVARGTWDGRALTNVRDIFHSQSPGTEASRLAFGGDGMLYATVSAPGGRADGIRAQDPNDYAGKVVRLRDDGSIPADNPFVRRVGYRPGIYTLGHRNGHSLAINPDTGALWASEQGPNGGDEINVLKRGRNYGWPLVSHGRQYFGALVSEKPWRAGTEQPAVYWVPSIAVTGMTFYTGNRFPAWKGNVFVGGMREGEMPRTGQLQRLIFNEQWQELRREPLLRDLHQRIRDVRQGPDGLLYVLTAEDAGALLRIEPDRGSH